MVSRGDTATIGQGPWYAWIEGLYAAIESIPVDGYRADSSDAWTRARGPTPTTHLSFWLFVGDEVVTSRGGTMVLRSRMTFAARYVAEQHPEHLARAHAAAHAVAARLQGGGVAQAQAVRCVVSGWTPDYSAVEAGWILIDLTFDVHVPW